jgi:hypothetical protein
MSVVLDNIAFLNLDVTNQIKAVLDNLDSSVKNKGFRTHIMQEFDLRLERDNLDDARKAVESRNEAAAAAQDLKEGNAICEACVKLMVPQTHEVSEDGTVLIMQWVHGNNVADYVAKMSQPPSIEMQRSLLFVMVKYYFNDLLVRKRLHMDLHPGNMIIQGLDDDGASSDVQVWIIDMGDELRPDEQEAIIMGRLLHLIHGGQFDVSKCATLWRELGVRSSRAQDEQFKYFSNCFDLIGGSEGLNFKENSEHIKFLTMPQKVVLWQKATNAFVMTLQTLRGKFPQWQDGRTVRDVVSQALSSVFPVDFSSDPLCRAAKRAKPE